MYVSMRENPMTVNMGAHIDRRPRKTLWQENEAMLEIV